MTKPTPKSPVPFAFGGALLSLIFLFASSPRHSVSQEKPEPSFLDDFEGERNGPLPQGFKTETTNPLGPPAIWQVIHDHDAPSGNRILALTCAREGFGSMYNLCWTDRVEFRDGALEVKVKARAGTEDRGGGPIWRVRDKNHYYLARWNPLEDNLRIYKVVEGRRIELASARVEADPETWHTIRIEHQGDRILGSFDNKLLLDLTDGALPEEGGIGVWTRSNAETAFDDLEVWEENP